MGNKARDYALSTNVSELTIWDHYAAAALAGVAGDDGISKAELAAEYAAQCADELCAERDRRFDEANL